MSIKERADMLLAVRRMEDELGHSTNSVVMIAKVVQGQEKGGLATLTGLIYNLEANARKSREYMHEITRYLLDNLKVRLLQHEELVSRDLNGPWPWRHEYRELVVTLLTAVGFGPDDDGTDTVSLRNTIDAFNERDVLTAYSFERVEGICTRPPRRRLDRSAAFSLAVEEIHRGILGLLRGTIEAKRYENSPSNARVGMDSKTAREYRAQAVKTFYDGYFGLIYAAFAEASVGMEYAHELAYVVLGDEDAARIYRDY